MFIPICLLQEYSLKDPAAKEAVASGALPSSLLSLSDTLGPHRANGPPSTTSPGVGKSTGWELTACEAWALEAHPSTQAGRVCGWNMELLWGQAAWVPIATLVLASCAASALVFIF